MVAAEKDLAHITAGLCGDFFDKAHVVLRLHSGIAAELIDLIGRCLDQHSAPMLGGIAQYCFDYLAVCGTIGRNPDDFPLPAFVQNLQNWMQHLRISPFRMNLAAVRTTQDACSGR